MIQRETSTQGAALLGLLQVYASLYLKLNAYIYIEQLQPFININIIFLARKM